MSGSVQKMAPTVAGAILLAVVLSGCGGGGGVARVLIGDVPAGHGLAEGMITVAAGTSAEHGNVVVECPAGGDACAVTVRRDGTVLHDRAGGVPRVSPRFDAWGPPEHGLAAGEITVPAGESAEHGNLAITCPAGGGACVVRVGADGAAGYAATGGVPGFMFVRIVDLPAGHGLAAGEITVAAGMSAERGNVVVECPAGGGACVVTVTGDGTAFHGRAGGVPRVGPRYDAWGPPEHGLTAGEITVAAGESAEHGNVAIACPAGGSACVVRVGADGAAAYAATGGVPAFTFVRIVDLPAGHGLDAGEITVAAGMSAEHGNVVVECPARGGACVVTVTGDGTAFHGREGGVPRVGPRYDAWGPPQHGLTAGEIRVPAGESREQGNVAIRCPAGGRECVVRVGADGGASYAATGGVPAFMFVRIVDLPAGHGLVEGVIRVPAGTSAEHGNVVVECPAGGGDCVVTVMGDGTALHGREGGVPRVRRSYEPWGPRGHGLTAGEITVPAGETREHGNVAIACPAGGGACVIRVGADGGAAYAATGGVPAFTFVHRPYERDNPTAEDPLDHWNEPEWLRAALALSPVDAVQAAERARQITELLDRAGGDPTQTGTRLRNVRPEDIEVIGERDGITYGRWTGGPAGTLDIDLDWRFASALDEATRARMRRAAKSWSRRLLDTFDAHTVRAGTTARIGRPLDGRPAPTGTFTEDVFVNDILIAVSHDTVDRFSSAGPRLVEDAGDGYKPWFGVVTLAQWNLNEGETMGGSYWVTQVMAHEIGHAIGLVSWPLDSYSRFPSATLYVNREDHTFDGPEARRVNGGEPVPFQWVGPDGRWVERGTPGATVDYGHLGICNSIMAYCADERTTYQPTELDFALLDDIGYEVLDAETAAQPELYGYGAWGRYSAWGIGVEREWRYEDDGVDVAAYDRLRAGADAFGILPAADLADGALDGTVSWNGSLLGADLGQPMLPPVFGDAALQVELATLQGTAMFDDLTVYVDGVSRAFRAPRLEYDIGVSGNTFSDEGGRVFGGFYGPAHEEMAGVLDDRTVEVNLLAGFGGKR